MKHLKFFIATYLIISITISPVFLFAQTQTYDPTASTAANNKSFGGISYGGVGGAIVGCSNLGGLTVGGLTKLFNKDPGDLKLNLKPVDRSTAPNPNKPSAPGATKKTTETNSVPVKDSDVKKEAIKTTAEVKTANRKTQCLDGIAYAAAKTLLGQVSNKTLSWVNNGLDGNPIYVQDVASQLQNIRDEKLQSYLNSAQNSHPIFGNAIRSTITQQTTGLSDNYLKKVMDTPEAREYEAFQKNFSQGGWSTLLDMNKNPIGATFNSADKLQKVIDRQQESLINEIQRNNGFLDMKECVEYDKSKNIAHTERQYNLECKGPGLTTRPAWCTDYEDTLAGKNVEAKCIKYKTVTPGSLISSQVQQVLGSPVRQLELADSLNEVLSGVFNQIIDGLLQRGLYSLRDGRSNFSNFSLAGQGFGSGLSFSGNNNNVFDYQNPGTGYGVQEFDISRPQMLRSIIKTQKDFINQSIDSQIAMQTIVPTLGALDYCIPGPNPTWNNGVDDNLQRFLSSFITPTETTLLKRIDVARASLSVLSGASTGAGLGTLILPGIGTAIGAAVGAVVGFLASLSSGSGEKPVDYALLGDPALYDKVSNTEIQMSSWMYLYYTKDYSRGVKGVNSSWLYEWISEGYRRVVQKYKDSYTTTAIVKLFTDTDADKLKAEGNIRESLSEASKLLDYNASIEAIDSSYDENIENTQDAVYELESIQKEALAIVKKAKARHIAEQARLGNPVKLSCIDKAYVIDETPVVGKKRLESSSSNSMILRSQEAKEYFYSQL